MFPGVDAHLDNLLISVDLNIRRGALGIITALWRRASWSVSPTILASGPPTECGGSPGPDLTSGVKYGFREMISRTPIHGLHILAAAAEDGVLWSRTLILRSFGREPPCTS